MNRAIISVNYMLPCVAEKNYALRSLRLLPVEGKAINLRAHEESKGRMVHYWTFFLKKLQYNKGNHQANVIVLPRNFNMSIFANMQSNKHRECYLLKDIAYQQS